MKHMQKEKEKEKEITCTLYNTKYLGGEARPILFDYLIPQWIERMLKIEQFLPQRKDREEDKKAVAAQAIMDKIKTEYKGEISIPEEITEMIGMVLLKDGGNEKSSPPAPIIRRTALCNFIQFHSKTLGIPIITRNQKYYVWNGKVYKPADKELFKHFLQTLAPSIGMADELIDDNFIDRCANDYYTRALSLIEPPNFVHINCNNGLVKIDFINDAPDVKLIPHNPKYFITHINSYNYDKNATCPLFTEQLLGKSLKDDDTRHSLMEHVGSIYIPKSVLKIEEVAALYGEGSNGKSVFAECIIAMIGEENVSNVPLNVLCEDPVMRCEIENKLLNLSTETEAYIRNISVFKQIASQEPISARKLYVGAINLQNYARLIVLLNNLPKTNDKSQGNYRRWNFIPFTVSFKGQECDPNLSKKIIQAELPGILNLTIQAIQRTLTNKGITPSRSIENQKKEYIKENDNTMTFLTEENYFPATPNPQIQPKSILLKSLYERYVIYCKDYNYKPIHKNGFSNALRKNNYEIEIKRNYDNNKSLDRYVLYQTEENPTIEPQNEPDDAPF